VAALFGLLSPEVFIPISVDSSTRPRMKINGQSSTVASGTCERDTCGHEIILDNCTGTNLEAIGGLYTRR
jgi:hypothetical protein